MATAYIGLGSNLDDPISQIRIGLTSLSVLAQTRLLAQSSLYQSAPLGPKDQPDFINAVAKIETGLQPLSLLSALLDIEEGRGRLRTRRWGPRTLDLDIILYDQLILDTPRLTIPHPGLYDRNFVLYPLLEIEPDLAIPGYGLISGLTTACYKANLRVVQNIENIDFRIMD